MGVEVGQPSGMDNGQNRVLKRDVIELNIYTNTINEG